MSLLWSGLIAAAVAGAVSLCVTILNHRNENKRWLKDKKMRVYSDFVGTALELLMMLKDSYDNHQFEDSKYRKLLRKLRMADILILGSNEVMENYELVIERFTDFYKFAKADHLLKDYDGRQGHLISTSMSLRNLEGAFRKDIGLKPSKSDILNYPAM